MNTRLLAIVLFALFSCNGSNSKNEVFDHSIHFLDLLSIETPVKMRLDEERKDPSPYQLYYSEDKELEVQFRLMNNFAGDIFKLKEIYDRNAIKNDIEIIQSKMIDINNKVYFFQRTEGVMDNVNYHTMKLTGLHNGQILQCLIRTLTKNKERWKPKMDQMVETIQYHHNPAN